MFRVFIVVGLFFAATQFSFAHKVTTVSVIVDIDTVAQTFKVDLAMEVEPTGDPAIDDVISPEKAAREFAKNALVIFFDDAEFKNPKLDSEIIETSDEDTPEELRRLKAIVALSGKMPEGVENFLLYVNEETEASVVMVLRKDGKPARRLQVLFPGDFSRPFNVLPVDTRDPFEVAEKERQQSEVAKESEPLPASGVIRRGIGEVFPDGTIHWVFGLGFLLLCLRRRSVIFQAVAFVISLALGLILAALDVLSIPESTSVIVMGLGVVYLGAENLITEKLKPWRLPAIFGIGLFHGFAFAKDAPSTIRELIGFNLGIEIAIAAFLMIGWLVLNILSRQEWYRKTVVIPANLALIGTGIYWAFFG